MCSLAPLCSLFHCFRLLLSFLPLPLAVGQRPLPSSSPVIRHRNDCPTGGWCSTNTLCFSEVILESWAAKQIFLSGMFGEKMVKKMEKQPCLRSDDFHMQSQLQHVFLEPNHIYKCYLDTSCCFLTCSRICGNVTVHASCVN